MASTGFFSEERKYYKEKFQIDGMVTNEGAEKKQNWSC